MSSSNGNGSLVDNYIASIGVALLLPLLPIVFEAIISKTVSQETLTISAALYTINIGYTSKLKSFFALSMIAGFVLAGIFGLCHSPTFNFEMSRPLSYAIIGISFFISCIERYLKHIRDEQPFFNF